MAVPGQVPHAHPLLNVACYLAWVIRDGAHPPTTSRDGADTHTSRLLVFWRWLHYFPWRGVTPTAPPATGTSPTSRPACWHFGICSCLNAWFSSNLLRGTTIIVKRNHPLLPKLGSSQLPGQRVHGIKQTQPQRLASVAPKDGPCPA